jgi:hydrogenase/urease accessory protein HupE
MAHESRPVHIRIVQTLKTYDVFITVPSSVASSNLPLIKLGISQSNKDKKWLTTNVGFMQNWSFQVEEALKNKEVSIDYPLFNPVLSTIVSLQFSDGDSHMLIIPPNQRSINIPEEVDQWQVLKRYTMLGVRHIWAGIDHLLFVVCLLFITTQSRKIWITITGFTITHSITLVMSALDIMRFPIPPIEATIALSIVFLCYEIIHHNADKWSFTYKYPIVVSSSFGLLHGLGFASVLSDIGLPYNHHLKALLFFNIGVELGQILFIILVFIAVIMGGVFIKKMEFRIKEEVYRLGLRTVVYCVGSIASFWMLDRLF